VSPEARELVANTSYLIASILFILTLRGLSSPRTARRGLQLGELGMLIAVVGTLLKHDIVRYEWIAAGLALGTAIGVPMGLWIPMTKMPERIALSHAFGGLAAALVGVSEYGLHALRWGGREPLERFGMGALGFEVLFGCLTFTGSLMAFGKLQGLISGAPFTYRLQNASNLALFAGALIALAALVWNPELWPVFGATLVAGTLLGVLFVLPIGGADMPVVVSLLNSYAGLAAAATGFALENPILIVAGALDGTSGFLLAMLMSRAMNRSFANVLFGAVGTDGSQAEALAPASAQQPNVASVDEIADLLRSAQSVILVPGYGMAVSQAQHACRELAEQLESLGASVKYAIHPVAGRMPGHMNVLLAEANVPYDQLRDLEEINDEFPRTQIAVVIGANDVVNPAARSQSASPIYGMPILDVDRAGAVVVLKRSLKAGFAGIDNELFYQKNTLMLLGDARTTLLALVRSIKGEASLHGHG
jgi:NAD(P) transhydrogenase subunit beta